MVIQYFMSYQTRLLLSQYQLGNINNFPIFFFFFEGGGGGAV